MNVDAAPHSTFEPNAAAPSAWIAASHVRLTALAQGVYFVATGLWPILHLRSFEVVTGPKVDGWLVKTFGALVGSVGGALILGAVESPASRTLRALGVGSAAALALADVIYVAKGRIARVYLLDAAVELALVGAWVLSERAQRNAAEVGPSTAP